MLLEAGVGVCMLLAAWSGGGGDSGVGSVASSFLFEVLVVGIQSVL